jgi:hypothetical protein
MKVKCIILKEMVRIGSFSLEVMDDKNIWAIFFNKYVYLKLKQIIN